MTNATASPWGSGRTRNHHTAAAYPSPIHPSSTHRFYDRFNAYLAELHKADPAMPANAVELSQKASIKLLTTAEKDAENIGVFVRFRPAFYVAGETEAALHNAIYLLDGFWCHVKERHPDWDLMVTLRPHINVDIDATWDHVQETVFIQAPYRGNMGVATLPHGLFQSIM